MSKRELFGDAAGALEVGVKVDGADVSKRLMISWAADRGGAAAAGADEAGTESPPVPKMSARRSCVVCLAGAPFRPADGGAASSPMRSTSESLSVRVDPTGFLSLTLRISANVQ